MNDSELLQPATFCDEGPNTANGQKCQLRERSNTIHPNLMIRTAALDGKLGAVIVFLADFHCADLVAISPALVERVRNENRQLERRTSGN